jgi:hypothetical protein
MKKELMENDYFDTELLYDEKSKRDFRKEEEMK